MNRKRWIVCIAENSGSLKQISPKKDYQSAVKHGCNILKKNKNSNVKILAIDDYGDVFRTVDKYELWRKIRRSKKRSRRY